MPTTFFQSTYPNFNAGSKVGPFVLRGTNPANPQTPVFLGVTNPTFNSVECIKFSTVSTYNYETVISDNAFTLYHFESSTNNTCQLLTQGIKAIGDIRINTLPVDGDTIIVNSGSVGKTYRFKTVLAAVNDVKIGATIIATASNLAKAIMLSGVAGIDYSNGTTIHPFFTAVAYGEVIVLTDKVGCLRINGYTLTASNGTRFSTRTPSGGVDGTLLAETNGTTITQFKDVKVFSFNKFNSSNVSEKISNYNLFPFFTIDSQVIEVPQAHGMMHIYAEITNVDLYGFWVVYGSLDGITWDIYTETYDDYLYFPIRYDLTNYLYYKIRITLTTPPFYTDPMYPRLVNFGITTI